MKNAAVARTITSLLLGVLWFGIAAHAQHIERVIEANIPFDFSAGNQTFSAGHYSLVSVTPSLLELRDADGRYLTTVLTNSVESIITPTSPKLQFVIQNGRHVLAQVWRADDSIGQQLPPAKPLTEVAGKRHSKHVQTASAGNPQ